MPILFLVRFDELQSLQNSLAQDVSALRCASERLRSSKDFLLEVLRGTPSEQALRDDHFGCSLLANGQL